jgi:hypothetical protein
MGQAHRHIHSIERTASVGRGVSAPHQREVPAIAYSDSLGASPRGTPTTHKTSPRAPPLATNGFCGAAAGPDELGGWIEIRNDKTSRPLPVTAKPMINMEAISASRFIEAPQVVVATPKRGHGVRVPDGGVWSSRGDSKPCLATHATMLDASGILRKSGSCHQSGPEVLEPGRGHW